MTIQIGRLLCTLLRTPTTTPAATPTPTQLCNYSQTSHLAPSNCRVSFKIIPTVFKPRQTEAASNANNHAVPRYFEVQTCQATHGMPDRCSRSTASSAQNRCPPESTHADDPHTPKKPTGCCTAVCRGYCSPQGCQGISAVCRLQSCWQTVPCY